MEDRKARKYGPGTVSFMLSRIEPLVQHKREKTYLAAFKYGYRVHECAQAITRQIMAEASDASEWTQKEVQEEAEVKLMRFVEDSESD